MKRVIDNLKIKNYIIAIILFGILYILDFKGNLFFVYMFSVLLSLLFFSAFQSYFFVAPIITVICGGLVLGHNLLDTVYLIEIIRLILILLVGLIIVGIKHFEQIKNAHKYPNVIRLFSDDKLLFNEKKLKASHLSAKDLSFFKSEMRKYYNKYQYLQSVKGIMEKKLNSYNQDLVIIKSIFNELIDSPRLLLKMNEFLYSHLDSYVEKVKAIIDFEDNVITSKKDQQLIENTLNELMKISDLFHDDFIQVTEDERNALKG